MTRLALLATLLVLLGAVAPSVWAQQAPPGVQIETAPPPTGERLPAVVPPGLHYETTRPPDGDRYSHDVRVEHDPAFIEPFAQPFGDASGSGQFGLAGWTSPNTPVGPSVIGYREVNGWIGFGFSIVWGGPPRPARPAPATLTAPPAR